jgi:hypothetical protein
VFAVTENVSVGIGSLAALLERLAYNIMLVKNIFKIHFKLLQVYYCVMNQMGNSNFPPSVHLIFFSTNIRNENNTREIQKWPRTRDRT